MKKLLSGMTAVLLLASVLASCGESASKAPTTEATPATDAAVVTEAPVVTEPATTEEVITEPPIVYTEVFTPVVEYNFDDSENAGWRTNNQTKGFKVDGGYATVTSTGGDPSIANKGTIGLDCASINAIRIRFINGTSDDNIQIFFTTDETTAFCEPASFKNSLDYTDSEIDGDEWNEVVFYTEECDLWEGTLKTMRIDLSNGEGDYKIDYITFDSVELVEQK